MENKEFKLVIHGKKENGENLVEIDSEQIITKADTFLVLNAMINSVVDSFGYNPMDLMIEIMANYYRVNSDDFMKELDKVFDDIYSEECPIIVLNTPKGN